jgi:predicted ribosome quality control (RQC) complex YloA/Tae2 family protein
VERLYRLARRAERAGTEAGNRIPEAADRLDLLTRALASLTDAESAEEIRAVAEELPAELRRRYSQLHPSGARRASREPRRAEPWRTYITKKGTRILAGRGAKENDMLTLRHANGNDVWLHVRGRPGAHVVIRAAGAAPSPDLLRLAAQVAMAHSGIAEGDAVDVIWTRVKHVRKRRGMAPGAVVVTQERTLHLRADRSALDELERTLTE